MPELNLRRAQDHRSEEDYPPHRVSIAITGDSAMGNSLFEQFNHWVHPGELRLLTGAMEGAEDTRYMQVAFNTVPDQRSFFTAVKETMQEVDELWGMSFRILAWRFYSHTERSDIDYWTNDPTELTELPKKMYYPEIDLEGIEDEED